MIIIATHYGALKKKTNITPILQTRKWRPRGSVTQLGIAKQWRDSHPIRALSCQSWWPSDLKKMGPHSLGPSCPGSHPLHTMLCPSLKNKKKKGNERRNQDHLRVPASVTTDLRPASQAGVSPKFPFWTSCIFSKCW